MFSRWSMVKRRSIPKSIKTINLKTSVVIDLWSTKSAKLNSVLLWTLELSDDGHAPATIIRARFIRAAFEHFRCAPNRPGLNWTELRVRVFGLQSLNASSSNPESAGTKAYYLAMERERDVPKFAVQTVSFKSIASDAFQLAGARTPVDGCPKVMAGGQIVLHTLALLAAFRMRLPVRGANKLFVP